MAYNSLLHVKVLFDAHCIVRMRAVHRHIDHACAMLESGSGPGIGHKAISHGRIRRSTRRQQSHTEEYDK